MVTDPYRIVIGDDAVAVRARLREALCTQAPFVEVCEASDAPGTIVLIQALQPALVILDLSMPGGWGAGRLRLVGGIPGVLYANRVYKPFAFSVSAKVSTSRCAVLFR